MSVTIPDGLAVCPAWCVDCFLDSDGSLYHRSAVVEVGRQAAVHAFAWQPAQGPAEAPTFTLHTSQDVEYTAEELRGVLQGFGEFVARF